MAENEPKEDRKGTHINLTPRAREVIENLKRDTGMVQKTAIERIFEWFAAQDFELQTAILTKNEIAQQKLLRETLGKLIGLEGMDLTVPAHKLSVEEAALAIHALTDRIASTNKSLTLALKEEMKESDPPDGDPSPKSGPKKPK